MWLGSAQLVFNQKGAFLMHNKIKPNVKRHGVSGNKWRLSVKACVTTFMASVASGWVGMIQSYAMNNKKMDVLTVVNGILGGLVGITAGCAVVNVYESLFIGAVGSFLANISAPLLNWLKLNLHISPNLCCF